MNFLFFFDNKERKKKEWNTKTMRHIISLHSVFRLYVNSLCLQSYREWGKDMNFNYYPPHNITVTTCTTYQQQKQYTTCITQFPWNHVPIVYYNPVPITKCPMWMAVKLIYKIKQIYKGKRAHRHHTGTSWTVSFRWTNMKPVVKIT